MADNACPIEAVFGPDERYECTFLRGHDGSHSWITSPSAASALARRVNEVWQSTFTVAEETPQQRKHLVLHIEIDGFWADDLDQCAAVLSEPDPPGPEDRLFVVTEEWMRTEVGITLISLPGEKCMSDDFEVHAYTGRIVGAETREVSHD